jgi:hypothetical protein
MRIMTPNMRTACQLLLLLPLAACGQPDGPTMPDATASRSGDHANNGNGVIVMVKGRGVVDLSALASQGFTNPVFFINAKLKADGRALGHFRQSRARNGLTVDFAGRVTCMTIDKALGRVRVGGVITENNSTDPAFLTENHEVGDDVWFRLVDGGEGGTDASTTYGFKPTLVNTSAEYCALPFEGLPWWNPASTFPLLSGDINIKY